MMLSVAAVRAAAFLADTTPDGPEDKKASALGLAVILALAVACFFLFRSMTRHMRKVREQFPVRRPGEPPQRHTELPRATGDAAAPEARMDGQPPGRDRTPR